MYSLNIISHHSESDNKTLRKHKVEGVDTIGVKRDEPFEIRFTNSTWFKVQVKLSLDGIDIMSGELATSEPTGEMWVVQPMGTLSIKAFPETDNGGAALVFSHAGNSVAVHTHGDLSHRGIIACAVYMEGAPEPLRLAPIVITNPIVPYWWNNYWWQSDYLPGITWTYNTNINTYGGLGGGTYSCSTSNAISGDVCGAYTSNSIMASPETPQDQQSLPGIGAGQYVEQKIDHTTGLNKPLLVETIQVRYLWWEELETKLSSQMAASMHPSGFPADTKKRINLGNVPRIGTPETSVPAAQPFLRLEP